MASLLLSLLSVLHSHLHSAVRRVYWKCKLMPSPLGVHKSDTANKPTRMLCSLLLPCLGTLGMLLLSTLEAQFSSLLLDVFQHFPNFQPPPSVLSYHWSISLSFLSFLLAHVPVIRVVVVVVVVVFSLPICSPLSRLWMSPLMTDLISGPSLHSIAFSTRSNTMRQCSEIFAGGWTSEQMTQKGNCKISKEFSLVEFV